MLPGKLMCREHWRQVPLVIQFDVYRTWATLKKARAPDLRLAAVLAYRTARDRAVRAVSA